MTPRDVIVRQLDLARERVAVLQQTLDEYDRHATSVTVLSPPPPALPPASPKPPKSDGPTVRARVEAIAKLLREHGPLQKVDLARRLGLLDHNLHDAIKHEWFEKSGPETRAPYRLSVIGERDAPKN